MSASNENQFISIVLPTYNEELAVASVIEDIRKAMATTSYEYEIIVVDDGSTDASARIAKSLGARVVQHARNRGNGWARNTGVKWARGDIIVMSDTDGTYPLHEIPRLLEELKHCDMVIGARKLEAGTMRWLRIPAKMVLKTLAATVAGERIPDLNSGMRAFRKSTAIRFRNILPRTHSWVSTITLAYLCNNYTVHYMPIDYYPRIGKSTFHPVRDSYNYFSLILRTVLFFRPLRFFLPLSAILCLWGLSKFTFDWQFYSDVRESDIMIILVGIIVGVLGLLADMIIAAQKTQYIDDKPTFDQELK